jgi:hypothetical protein
LRAHANRHGYSDSYLHIDGNPNSHPGGHADLVGDAHRDRLSDAYVDGYTDCYGDADLDAYCDCYGHAKRNRYGDLDKYATGHADAIFHLAAVALSGRVHNIVVPIEQ